MISQHGYQPNRKTSLEATEWLEWLNTQTGGKIQHGRNGKEVKIGKYFVDGLDALQKVVYEYNGCVFHGCPTCQNPEDAVPFSDTRMKEAFELFGIKSRFLKRQVYQLQTM